MQVLVESLAGLFSISVMLTSSHQDFFLKHTAISQQGDMEYLIDSAANISQQCLLGISKMILAIPMIAIFKIICDHI